MTSYENWMKDRIFKETGISELSRESLELYQLKKLRMTIDIAKKSKFYGEALKDIESSDIKGFADFKKLPFTTTEDLVKYDKSFLCVPTDEISRIVTINSSGTSGVPKRIYFTENDLKATSEFFTYGMLNLINKGEKVLILMSGSSTSSIAQLLKKGLNDAGCDGIIYGPVIDAFDVLNAIKQMDIGCIVGLPVQVYYLAKLKNTDERFRNIKLNSILLSADYVPKSIKTAAGGAFGCPVFTHYGMTEMGYGGGVECSALNGYHMRDVDLYTEIIDPVTFKDVPSGCFGEVVFTTLSREGMPLIRYRTGDISRLLPLDCKCSDALKRMDYVAGRYSEFIKLPDGKFLSIGMIDEVMFGIEDVLDFRASVNSNENIVLNLSIKPVNIKKSINFTRIENTIRQDENLGKLVEENDIEIKFTSFNYEAEISRGSIKRKLNKTI
jgi:phenylacetate-CoA ligase